MYVNGRCFAVATAAFDPDLSLPIAAVGGHPG